MKLSTGTPGYPQEATAAFEMYQHMPDGRPRHELSAAIQLAELVVNQSLASVETPDLSYENGAMRAAGFVITQQFPEQQELPETELADHETRAEFVELFNRGVEAFFPESLPYADRIKLFDLSLRAIQRPNGKAHVNETIYEARAAVIEQLIGKRFKTLDAYHGIDLQSVFAMASWAYGESDEAVAERGWSADPVDVFKPNPGLLSMKLETLQGAVRGLAIDTGVAEADILTKAHRAIYRYSQHPDVIRLEISTMRGRGLIEQAMRRPDMLNYPVAVQERKEAAYVAMGIPLSAVRANAKFYVYKTETIQQRITRLGEVVDGFECLTSEDRRLLVERFTKTARMVLDCGQDKIAGVAELVRSYTTPDQWQEAMEVLGQHRQDDTPQGAALYYLGRVSLGKLKSALEETPQANIFLLARDLVNKPKADQKRKRREEAAQQ